MARRAVFGFPLALLGPFGGDALWRRFPGFPAWVVNAEATGLASGLGPSRCCHSGACVGCSQGCGRCGRILEDDFPGGLGARERSLSFPERRNERSERGDAGMRLGGVAALAGVTPAPAGSRQPGGIGSIRVAVGERLGPAPGPRPRFRDRWQHAVPTGRSGGARGDLHRRLSVYFQRKPTGGDALQECGE